MNKLEPVSGKLSAQPRKAPVAGDMLRAQWPQLRAYARQWWGELTEDDLDEVQGRRHLLVEAIQKRYGRSREEAEAEINRFLVRVTGLLGLE